MRRLLSTTTALALAITPMAPLPVFAQTVAEDGSVIGEDGTVLCTPTAEAPCDLKAIKKQMKKAAKQAEEAAATEAGAADAAAEEAAAAAAAEQKAAEEAAAQAEAERQAAEAAAAEQKAAEEAAAAQAAAEAVAAQAAAEQKAAEEAAAAAAAEQQAAEAAAAQAAADAEQKAAEDAAAAQAAAEQKAAEEAAAAEAAAQAAAEATAADDPAGQTAETGGASQPAPGMMPDQTPGEPQPEVAPGPSKSMNDQPNVEAPQPDATAGDGTTASEDPADSGQASDDPAVPVAEQTIDPNAVTTPPSEEEVQALTELLAQPESAGGETAATAAAAAGAETAAATATAVTETVLTEEDTRSSTEDFATTASGKKKKKKDKDKDEGLSDFEKAGLVALGALAVGVLLSNRDQVVSNTGDRVVVQRSDGNYAVYKDDDALLRQPGSAVKTETFKDGSTRTTVTRDDGTSVVTIRDATGRVLKRSAYDTRGRETVLIDDLVQETPVVVSTLPKPTAPVISTQGGDPELAAALAAIQARDIGRTFSLRQVRDIKEVRVLAAAVDVDNITFDTGSAAITAAQAENLADLGSFLKKMLAKNPGEIFLVEGHTDAVGSAASNLALSDRRAESVALALTEYFGVPPENLVVQGYGESDLRIATDGDERRNRRVAVRVITPLLTVASLR